MTTLREALAEIPDIRGRSGRMYALESLILLVLAGFMSGCDSLAAVWRFGQRLDAQQRKSLGFLWHQMPSHPALCVFFHTLDVAALEKVLGRFIQQGNTGDERLHLAIKPAPAKAGGKTLRGSKSAQNPHGVHLLACYSAQLKGVVAQRKAARGGDEAVAALEILHALSLENTLLTGDAMFATRAICGLVTTKKGDYLLPVKGNQNALKRSIEKAVAEKKLVGVHEESHTSHGRVETRRIEVCEVGFTRWPGVKQWGIITRRRTEIRSGKTTTECIAFITSLGRSQATPAELLATQRRHWQIENGLHRTRDTLMKEDASSIRKGHSPQSTAALHSFSLNRLAMINPSPTQAREIAQNDKVKLFQLLDLFIK